VVPGHHATVGYIEFLRRPVPETASTLVDMLLNAGAVLYCKTNVPQTMMVSTEHGNSIHARDKCSHSGHRLQTRRTTYLAAP
jgi:Asp-tRNA(Asn)/Glu-tRNA(Gln) amidotransferase A subunit family amidase